MKEALFVTLEAIKNDEALKPGGRGARKIVVTEIFEGKEKGAENCIWKPALKECPVQTIPCVDNEAGTEIAVFNELTSQDRHYHKIGTEIYMLIEGRMIIEVEGTDYSLSPGDMIVVNPKAIHEVKRSSGSFLCRVVTVNCKGRNDKYIG